MSDPFRQVGPDTPGGITTITAAMCKRQLAIEPKPSAIYTVEGDRAVLLAGRPEFGATFETIESVPFIVTKVLLDDLEGGDSATMTIHTEAAMDETAGTFEPIGEAQYSVKFAELRRKIEAHPLCGRLTTLAVSLGKSWENWQSLADGDYDSSFSPAAPAYSGKTVWTLSDYQEMKRRGVEDFIIFAPVVTRTLTYTGRPSDMGEKSGHRDPPPAGSFGAIDDYEWLRGADEIQQRGGKYERTTTWMGADYVDENIYPLA